MAERLILLTICLILATSRLEAAVEYDPEHRCRVDAPEKMLRPTLLFVDSIERGINHYLGSPPQNLFTPVLSLKITAPPVTEATDPLSVNLSTANTEREYAHKIALALIRRRKLIQESVAGMARKMSRKDTGGLSWLAAATVHDVVELNRYLGTSRIPNYQPVFNLLEIGKTPDVETLISHPVDPKYPYIYRLYALHCHLLANLLRNASIHARTTVLAQYLSTLAPGSEPAGVLGKAYREVVADDTSLQEWYRKTAPAYCVRYGATRSINNTLKRLDEIMRIKITTQEDGSVTDLALTDVESSDLVAGAKLLKKTRQLINLQREAPSLLRPALADYTTAMAGFRAKRNIRRFRKKINRAKENLEEAVDRLKQTHGYLDTLKAQLDIVPWELYWYTDIIRDKKERGRNLLPEIETFLDEFEARNF